MPYQAPRCCIEHASEVERARDRETLLRWDLGWWGGTVSSEADRGGRCSGSNSVRNSVDSNVYRVTGKLAVRWRSGLGTRSALTWQEC